MLSQHPRRRRPQYGARSCALTAALLLLFTLYLLHSRSPLSSPLSLSSFDSLSSDPLLDDTDPDPSSRSNSEPDLIDVFDNNDPDPDADPEPDNDDEDETPADTSATPVYKFDQVGGVVRRPFDRRSIDQWDDYTAFGQDEDENSDSLVFGSDDVVVDEDVRRKVVGVRGMEDALLLKGSGLREGWGPWFQAKSYFLKRDKMFRSNLENLDPLNNPMLQDPDGVGVTGLTKGDKLVMKGFMNEFKKVPFLVKKPLGVDENNKVVESMKKPLEVKNTGNSVEGLSKKDMDNGVENLAKKGKEIVNMKKLLVVRGLNNGVDDLPRKDSEIARMKGTLLIRDPKHELDLKSERGSMSEPLEINDSTHFRSKSGRSRVSSKTNEISSIDKPKFEVMGDGEVNLIKLHNGDVNVDPKPLGRRVLRERVIKLSSGRRIEDTNDTLSNHKAANMSSSNMVQSGGSQNVKANAKTKQGSSSEVYANGKRWGYFPGLNPRLSFSNFMDAFFRKGKCSMRVFMVWNSPPWAFTVRQQRGLESLLFHNRDACVVVFSETIELNFFEGFVKDGFKVAVTMPNLDELLKDTPTHVFASLWYEWRKVPFYSMHYSELIRLAALYKYGGTYLDSDVIVLRPLSFSNTVGLMESRAGSSLNGAVMSFKKHSPFIMECLTEFYATYDDTKMQGNGADLLTRVANKFSRNMEVTDDKMELKLQHASLFFPISHDNITRYFSAPETETQRAKVNRLVAKILKESSTFHYWNSLTSALIPEPESLVARIINQYCIRCDDVL